jgi:XRE family transcriptional regulator, fatty acid utilization regulator
MVVVVTMTNDDPRLKFGREIRRLRQALGLTLEELAHRCGVSPNYIGSIENGHRDPSLSTVRALARGLGVTTGELVGPTTKLSDAAVEMAQLFDEMAQELQGAILKILRGSPKKPRK